MKELTEEELLNPARNESETQTQFKQRRRIIKHSLELYLKTGAKGLKVSYYEFTKLCIRLSKK